MKPILKQFLKQFLTAVLLVSVLLTGSAASAGISCGGTALAAENKEPSIKAKTAIVYCATTGEVVWEKNADKQMNPASMTKLMTCLIAAENSRRDETVTFSHNAVFSIDKGSSNIGIDAGQAMPMEECLYGILTASANEVANGVAEHIAGSTDAFAELMNRKAEELGCKNTHFVNAHGLYDEEIGRASCRERV